MSIVERLRCIGAVTLVVATFGAGAVAAHPVSQGALDIVIFPGRLAVTARVSMEEALVAAAYGEGKDLSTLEMLRQHGEYLLAHLRIKADGRPLPGRVVKLPEQAGGPSTYQLEYEMTGDAPARIALEEDVLREFEFTPGNPWEASYVVRVSWDGRPPVEGLLLTWREPLILDMDALASASESRLDKARMAKEYLRHGIMHILSGYDHLLFIAALALAVATLWDLVRVISAFTLAHSITLTLSVLNVVRLPSNVVEPMIAASIVFVALQNVIVPEQSRGAGRLAVAFFFGLFHGLGFAGGLLSAMEGMAGVAVGLAILAFSLGVEVGHQMIVLPIFGAMKAMRGAAPHAAQISMCALRYGSVGILVAGTFYLVAALLEALRA